MPIVGCKQKTNFISKNLKGNIKLPKHACQVCLHKSQQLDLLTRVGIIIKV